MPSPIETPATQPPAQSHTVSNPSRLVYQPVIGFIEQIAAKSAAPGGGSAAALSGSIGAGLLTMVINFTIDKSEYASVASSLRGIRESLEVCRRDLTAAIDEDTDAFNALRVASKLPVIDDLDRARKARELRVATERTIAVPRQTIILCLTALEFAPTIARDGNVNTVSDAGTGAEMLLAGVEGAAYNVLINLPGIDESERLDFRRLVADARLRARDILEVTRKIVSEKIAG